jgi:hypothetical protein
MKAMARAYLLLGLMPGGTPVVAQYGMCQGKAKDRTLSPLADVRITLVDSMSDTIATTLSTADGRYELNEVRAGTYTLVAEQAGYELLTQKGIQVHLNTITFIDMTLTRNGNTPAKGNVCNWRRKG